ncbi:MAG: hypothetical protein U0572_13995 [Phycisphaerales bacterium]
MATRGRAIGRAVSCAAAGMSCAAFAVDAPRGGAPSGGWRAERSPVASDAAGGVAGGGEPGADVALGGSREPVIAVDHSNPQRLAMSSLFQYRVSTNGGQTWTAPASNVVPAGYALDGDPCMTYDALGRLFYLYQGRNVSSNGADEFCARLDPTTGAYISGPIKVSTSGASGPYNDKPWIAADRFASSPFANRLYAVWTEFPGNSTRVLFSSSSNQGITWTTPLQLSTSSEGFVWPAHVAVAPNGDVYVAYHSQISFNGVGEGGGNPTGSSGKIYVARSTDGGATFPQKNLAFLPGAADLTFNVQTSPGTIPQTDFWLQGSVQPWVLPDPSLPGYVYVVACDDPDNAHGSGDDADVFIVRSTQNGLGWSAPTRVDHAPGTSFSVMPTAAIDDAGCITVMWYDNRLGGTNASGNWLLNVFYTVSTTHGLSFGPDVQLSDAAIDPDLGAPSRYPGPPPTKRIGEYICIATAGTNAYGVWTGNTSNSQQILFDRALGVCAPCAGPGCGADLDGDGNVGASDLAILLGAWGTSGPGDLDFNGTVDAADVAVLLGAWSA